MGDFESHHSAVHSTRVNNCQWWMGSVFGYTKHSWRELHSSTPSIIPSTSLTPSTLMRIHTILKICGAEKSESYGDNTAPHGLCLSRTCTSSSGGLPSNTRMCFLPFCAQWQTNTPYKPDLLVQLFSFSSSTVYMLLAFLYIVVCIVKKWAEKNPHKQKKVACDHPRRVGQSALSAKKKLCSPEPPTIIRLWDSDGSWTRLYKYRVLLTSIHAVFLYIFASGPIVLEGSRKWGKGVESGGLSQVHSLLCGYVVQTFPSTFHC